MVAFPEILKHGIPMDTSTVTYWLNRIASYLLINVMDDPAWLALIFC
jgi:hypothetical protein